jgi:hypothetical protein
VGAKKLTFPTNFLIFGGKLIEVSFTGVWLVGYRFGNKPT